MFDLTDRSRIVRGASYSGAFAAVGIGIVLIATSGSQTVAVLGRLSPTFLALALASALVDMLIGPLRYHIFLRRVRPEATLLLPMRADLAGRFAGAITPSQSGGGPAQVFIFARGGVSVAESLAFLSINFLATLFFLVGIGGVAAAAVGAEVPDGAATGLIRFGLVVVGALTTLVLVTLVRPDLVGRVVAASMRGRPEPHSALGRALHRAGTWVAESVDRYSATCLLFLRHAPALIAGTVVLTALLYLNKFTLAWLVLRGVGANAPYLEVLAVQVLLQFILYVAPSPGGSGIAELSTAALMAKFMETEVLGVFTIAFRLFQMYLPASIGFLVLAHALGSATADLHRSAPSPALAAEPRGGIP